MKFIVAFTLVISIAGNLAAQIVDPKISAAEAERIERVLSSDKMEGRKTFSPGIDRAADFIAGEFKAAGLQTWKGAASFRQEFEMVQSASAVVSGTLNKQTLDPKNIIAVTSLPQLQVTVSSAFDTVSIRPGNNLFRIASKYIQANRNYLVLVDTSFSANFSRLSRFKEQMFKLENSVVFILTSAPLNDYDIRATQQINSKPLANVVGVLPGKSKPKEFVIFSAHYDHLGVGKSVDGDSIYNGANDDAAGTTAVIMLAKYFKALGNNERTLVFATFTGEEAGGFGSQYFSKQFDASSVMAMFNIEMIGTESKWGKNSAYMTGYDKSNMGSILETNLKGTDFKFYPDPYTEQQLFYRSDNATLARLGVPAHTISTSKMDSEKFYHTVNDEIENLDLTNMAMIIKAIALSSRSIVNGKDTPSRVDTSLLR